MNTKLLLSLALFGSLATAHVNAMVGGAANVVPVAAVTQAPASIVEPIAKEACSSCNHASITEKATKALASLKTAAANGFAVVRTEGSKLSAKAVDQYGKVVSFITSPKSWTTKDKVIVAAVVAGVAVTGYALYKWYNAPKAKNAKK